MGKDFSTADKGRKFSKGGDTMATKMGKFKKMGKDVEKRDIKEGSKKDMSMDRMQMMGMKKGGMTKMAGGGSASKRADGIASRGKTKGTIVKMNKGGMSC